MNHIVRILSLAVLLICFRNSALASETLYVNGAIYTVNEKHPWAEAMLIDGNRIVGVGSAQQLRSLIEPGVRVVNLQGKMVLPGFVEDHVHPDMAAENLTNILLTPSTMSWDQQKETILDFARKNPGKGGSWALLSHSLTVIRPASFEAGLFDWVEGSG